MLIYSDNCLRDHSSEWFYFPLISAERSYNHPIKRWRGTRKAVIASTVELKVSPRLDIPFITGSKPSIYPPCENTPWPCILPRNVLLPVRYTPRSQVSSCLNASCVINWGLYDTRRFEWGVFSCLDRGERQAIIILNVRLDVSAEETCQKVLQLLGYVERVCLCTSIFLCTAHGACVHNARKLKKNLKDIPCCLAVHRPRPPTLI